MKILGISGSVREGSFNRKLLLAAQELAPEHVEIEICDLADIPPYDADADREKRPEPVTRLKQAIAEADALLIASPEYNASFSGVLKNAIDWASRPLTETPLMGKPAAVMGASGGLSGTARAHVALAPVLDSVGVLVMPKPNVMVRQAANVFDDDGKLADQETRDRVQQLVAALVEWTDKVSE